VNISLSHSVVKLQSYDDGLKATKINSFIQTIYIAPLQVP